MEKRFSGPVFLVGMPRSGTKLLRDLLNKNNEVGIPVVESHFIPEIISRYKSPLAIKKNSGKFFAYFKNSSFYKNMRAEGISVKEEDMDRLHFDDWNRFFRSLFALFVPKENYRLWGDKTPGYLQGIGFLKEHFPQAKFLHIVRDPRDYALSQRNTWNKNEYRAVLKWKETITQGRRLSRQFPDDYLECRYEDLLTTPEAVLKSICAFLELRFDKNMLYLDQPSAQVESTKGKTHIVKDNFNKYRKTYSGRKLEKMERVAYPLITDLGYECETDITEEYELHVVEKGWYAFLDYIQMIVYYAKTKGMIKGIQYAYKIKSENMKIPGK